MFGKKRKQKNEMEKGTPTKGTPTKGASSKGTPTKGASSKGTPTENISTEYDNAVISWVAPETIRHDRGIVWKIVMSSITIGLATWALIWDSWTFALAIVVFAIVYSLINLEHPKDLIIKISETGIKVGPRKYPFNRIKAFWIIYEPPFVSTLNLRVSGEFISDITIQLDGQSPAQVREYLIDKIPEMEGQNEKFSDILLRIFKL